MSYSTYILGLNESNSFVEKEQESFPKDMSGFSEEADCFGCDKLEQPSKEGLDAAVDAMDSFANASDGQNTDIDLSFHDSFPKDNSGFEKDANSEIEPEEEVVDPATIPAHNAEADQFEEEGKEVVDASGISDTDLAKDDDDIVKESATGWDDLF